MYPTDAGWDDDGVHDHHEIAIRPIERQASERKLRRASSSVSNEDRHELLRNLTDSDDKKQPFAFGMLSKFTLLVNEMAGFKLLSTNVMFERFGVYLTDIKWDKILVCDPPSHETVKKYHFLTVDVEVNKEEEEEDAKKSKKVEQLETLPFMPKNGQKGIQKALHVMLNNLFFGGAYATLCREVKKPKVRHVLLLRDRMRPRCSASRTIDTSLLFKRLNAAELRNNGGGAARNKDLGRHDRRGAQRRVRHRRLLVHGPRPALLPARRRVLGRCRPLLLRQS
jgi:hypothetical protein